MAAPGYGGPSPAVGYILCSVHCCFAIYYTEFIQPNNAGGM